MQRKGPDPDEPLFVISVAARMVDLHPQTLRHYERIGLVDPARTEGGIRMYSQRDIERLRKITRLVDELGVNLAGVDVILYMSRQIEELQAENEHLKSLIRVEVRRRVRASLDDTSRRRPRLPNATRE
jgi:MerR family transcriptional regulator/heat shock protein HspR